MFFGFQLSVAMFGWFSYLSGWMGRTHMQRGLRVTKDGNLNHFINQLELELN